MDSNVYSTMSPEVTESKKGITGSTLKLVAIFTMLIDHIGAAIVEQVLQARAGNIMESGSSSAIQKFMTDNALLYGIDFIMRMIGRVAFPIFCFLLVEGMLHTHNKWKYASRLAMFALISEIPFDLAFNGKVLDWGYQNVFFTLLIGLLVMIGFAIVSEQLREKKWLPVFAAAGAIAIGCIVSYYFAMIVQSVIGAVNANGGSISDNSTKIIYLVVAVICSIIALIIYAMMYKKSKQTASVKFADLAVLAAGMILAEILKTDYSGFGVLTIAVIYALRSNHFKAMLGGAITLTIMSISEAPAFFDLILIHKYNGKRGMNLKYVFYLFYPVHLLILYLIYYVISH